MNLPQLLKQYQERYDVLAVISLDDWYSYSVQESASWLMQQVKTLHRDVFEEDQRIIFTLTQGDEYADQQAPVGQILTALQEAVNLVDISNFFVVVLTVWPDQIMPAAQELQKKSSDKVPLTFDFFESDRPETKKIAARINQHQYNYNSRVPTDLDLAQLTDREKYLLLESEVFCVYPWTHLNVSPDGTAMPCCGWHSQSGTVGNTNHHTMKEIWNGDKMKQIRLDMLAEKPIDGCVRCYEHERAGFFSMRHSANKHHGKHISRVHQTNQDGSLDEFAMVYWDVRFNNLCNLRCRSCGPQFSSSWYQDQIKIAPDYKEKALFYAGKYETDLWEQLVEHIDHVEQIYFAGGEPLMADEHYRILEELERRKKFNVRLIYNTNFTISRLGSRSIFDYWKKFNRVAVGASLDAMGSRAEYIRKGTDWADIENNRRQMMKICPQVDFYVSATLSVLNAWHLPDFHREWTEQGFIKARDFNINNLTDPKHYRTDILPAAYKKSIERKYIEHLAWLTPQDDLRRASNGFQSAIKFMNAIDNSQKLDLFWKKTRELDAIRNENILDIIPELANIT